MTQLELFPETKPSLEEAIKAMCEAFSESHGMGSRFAGLAAWINKHYSGAMTDSKSPYYDEASKLLQKYNINRVPPTGG